MLIFIGYSPFLVPSHRALCVPSLLPLVACSTISTDYLSLADYLLPGSSQTISSLFSSHDYPLSPRRLACSPWSPRRLSPFSSQTRVLPLVSSSQTIPFLLADSHAPLGLHTLSFGKQLIEIKTLIDNSMQVQVKVRPQIER
jgi:hypothetical protein